MWVKNTGTGHVWDVSDEHGERLLKEDYYEKTKKPSVQKEEVDQKSDMNEQS
ncbi:hypothetical protein [Domibacillus aminovorans]|uniref:hypothetical protein n=1 Tax=Domibacillus aminovorans TaxID=29332 RepID=UPI0012FD6B84|nr:hypothetical protein [Domibacillus aminovorans]